MANNISSLGSTVDALIICGSETVINGHTYQAGEPYTYLKGIMASVGSSDISPQASTYSPSNTGLHLLAGSSFLYQLILSNVSLTDKIRQLGFNNVVSGPATVWTRVNAATSKLKGEPQALWLYKDNELLTEGYSCVNEWLTIANFDTDATYMVCYSYLKPLHKFITQNYPYFKVVLYFTGNVANKTSSGTITFGKVALMPETALDFLPGVQNYTSLSFGIIDADKTVTVEW